ncbi:hypothetical protein BDV23DRAFT_143401 [Aspergillus alliaceus]|uniref:Uncharacterized protein n=2 Tax=Petromyces alliaceus TaxID=209559 RepID=A0A5N7CS09_PETAA|nr:uncharacterized protein BDW43DRAFT_275712 [Aspergillus alliaceus]KAB8233640.1 hypothetical protein BDW43DRAFT_275712 [Aspergillus alliaceus]KAE8396699.1 hypothetical protein BDV23DRAFT_143401 [Aspergillus alliaceus]
MPSIPPSPLRLSHRHNQSQSSIDFDLISPGTYAPNGFSQSPPRSPQSPRFSGPSSPARRHHAQSLNGSLRMSGDFGGAADMGGGGLGNLADELADAWEQEEGGYGYASGQEIEHIPVGSQPMDRSDSEDGYHMGTRTPSSGYSSERASLHPPRPKTRNGGHRHRRHESQYDGSDYGNDSDLEEAADISPSLEMQMAEIESLARRGIENNGSENDHVIARVVEALRDLGGQSGIENNAMRLITAHSSITSHLTHQTRTLQTLTHPLLFSPFPLLSTDAIDSLVPLIDDELLPNLPYPLPGQSRHSSRPATPSHSALDPLFSLQSLVSQTSEITLSLQSLSDTLYESRQLTATASRRLRSARELVAELRREEEGREEGTRWIEKGDWDRRLRDREAGRVCGDVVSGFEAVCGEWRERLFGAAGAEAAAAVA